MKDSDNVRFFAVSTGNDDNDGASVPSAVQVARVTIRHVVLPMKFAFVTAKGRLAQRDTLCVTVTDNTGLTGYGEIVAFTTPFYTAETLDTAWSLCTECIGPRLVGYRITNPEQVADDIVRLIGSDAYPMTTAGVENALLDLYYRKLGQPMVTTFFGEPLTPMIASGVVIGDMALDDMLAKVRREVEKGCKRIKLKINPSDAVERVSLVRRTFPEITLAADANRSFHVSEWPLIQALAPYKLACVEEPLDADVSVLGKLRQDMPSSTPICLDESVQSMDDLRRAHRAGALDVLNVKIGRLGGLARAKEIIHYCRRQHIAYWIGSMVESGISKWLHVQLAALPDTYMAGDLSDSARYFEKDVICPDIAFSEGSMQVPTGIGSGAVVDEAVLNQYTQRQVTFTP